MISSLRLRTMYRFITSRGSLPILLTLLSAAVVATALGALSAADAILLLFIGGTQSLLLVQRSLFAKAVALEKLDQATRLPDKEKVRSAALCLGLLPLLSLAAPWLSWLVFIAFWVYFFPSSVVLSKRLLNGKNKRDELVEAVQKNPPLIAVYVSGLASVAYQINQWLPVLERFSVPVVIVVRQRDIFNGMPETNIPIIYARSLIDVEAILSCGVKTVLYPANTMHNVQALRFYELNHFFINHGESDKAVNQSKLLMAYDKLLVAGPMAHRRLLEAGLKLRTDHVEHVGRPQTELQLKVIEQRDKSLPIKVLYAPTWEGFVDDVDYSSIGPLGAGLLRALAGGAQVEVVFKPHPYTGSRSSTHARYLNEMKAFCANSDIRLEEGLGSIHECMNESDILITDVSSVLNDYLMTRKPIILCVNERMAELADLDVQFPSSKAAYKLRAHADVAELVSQIDQSDSLREIRDEVRKDSLGDYPEGALVRFLDVVESSVSSKT